MQENKTFTKISEMSKEELRQLPVCEFRIVRQTSKKSKSEYFTTHFYLHNNLTISANLDQADFYSIQAMYQAAPGYNS